MTSYDAIVIGAGSVGNPTAFFLAEEGYKVLVLDKNASAGQGQNKAAIGGVRATHSDPAKIMICQASLDIFSSWEKEHDEYVGWKKGGYCFPVYGEGEEDVLRSILPVQKEHGLNIDWQDADYIKRIIPGINPKGLRGGTYSPDDGQVSPLLFSEAVVKAGKELGVDYHFKERVDDLLIKGEGIKGVKTPADEYEAEVVVNAAGAHASAVCRLAGLDIPVEPDSHEAGISAPVADFLAPLIVDMRPGEEGKTANFYFGQNSEGRIIFCYTPSTLFKGTDRRSTSEFMPVISRRLVDLIPRLKNLLVRRLWRGLYPMTPDGVPVVGPAPRTEGLYLAVGMCGQGFMLGPGVAKNLASYIAHGKPDIDTNVFEMLSPSRNFHKAKELLK